MAAVRKPFGFKPSRSSNGNFNPATRRYQTAGGLFAGDPVTVVSGVAAIPTTAQAVMGVVAGLLDTNQKPLVFNQPTRGPFLPPSTAGFADVYIDKSNIYVVATDTTATNTIINTWVDASALSSANTNNRSGRSPYGVQVANALASGGAANSWFVLGPAPAQRDHLTQADWVEGVEVMLRTTLPGQL